MTIKPVSMHFYSFCAFFYQQMSKELENVKLGTSKHFHRQAPSSDICNNLYPNNLIIKKIRSIFPTFKIYCIHWLRIFLCVCSVCTFKELFHQLKMQLFNIIFIIYNVYTNISSWISVKTIEIFIFFYILESNLQV